MLLAHRERPIPSLIEVRAEVPPGLDEIFHRMAAKQMSDRYQTMDDVVASLERLQLADCEWSSPQDQHGSPIVALDVTRPLRKNRRSSAPKAPSRRLPRIANTKAWRLSRSIVLASAGLLVSGVTVMVSIQLGSGANTHVNSIDTDPASDLPAAPAASADVDQVGREKEAGKPILPARRDIEPPLGTSPLESEQVKIRPPRATVGGIANSGESAHRNRSALAD
jgi:hypothetical protein